MADQSFSRIASDADVGVRLDVFLSSQLCDFTRSQITAMIRAGNVHVAGRQRKPAYRLCDGDQVTGTLPVPEPSPFLPEPMALDIRHEDGHVIVINKSAGVVVHPSPGHPSGTLVNGLLHHCPDLGMIGADIRPGIVHRLDKDTTGTLVVAKNAVSMANLTDQFKRRTVEKTYLALVFGTMPEASGQIQLPIGRHPTERKKMSVHSRNSREADTRWRVKETLTDATLLEIDLKTGRTHQIRVHCAAIQRPVIGDPIYGTRLWRRHQRCRQIPRQMLHAWRLTVAHPDTGIPLTVESPVPQDMADLIAMLRRPKM